MTITGTVRETRFSARKLHQQTARSRAMCGCILVALVGFVGAYAAGSCREAGATTYVPLVVATSLGCILAKSRLWTRENYRQRVTVEIGISGVELQRSHKSLSLLLLMSTFATAITYQAGLDPPGGVWLESSDGHLAGDPILLLVNASRGLGAHKVEAVMILELFGLIGAYTAGVSKNLSTSTYVLALGGTVMFYIVIHVIFFTLEKDAINFYVEQEEVEKKRKLLYLLATLSTAMSYHAGFNPPGGFLSWDYYGSRFQAGDPVLLHTYQRRYNAFLFCSSLSFMLSVSTMLLLVSPVLYRPAIRSYALTLCAAVGSSVLMGAYAAGSTQDLKTTIFLFVMIALSAVIVAALLVIFLVRDTRQRLTPLMRAEANEEDPIMTNAGEGELVFTRAKKMQHAEHKHLMLLGILVAGATYQAGLDMSGGVWQSDEDGNIAGWEHNMRKRYLIFFYSNSTSFAWSIVTILLLLLQFLKREEQYGWAMRAVIALDLLTLLVAYTAGSSRDWQLAVFVAVLLIPALAKIGRAHV